MTKKEKTILVGGLSFVSIFLVFWLSAALADRALHVQPVWMSNIAGHFYMFCVIGVVMTAFAVCTYVRRMMR